MKSWKNDNVKQFSKIILIENIVIAKLSIEKYSYWKKNIVIEILSEKITATDILSIENDYYT